LLGTSKQAIAEEEHPGPEAVHGRAEAQVAVHLERGEPDVHPVEEVEKV